MTLESLPPTSPAFSEAPETPCCVRCLQCLMPRQRRTLWAFLLLITLLSAAFRGHNLSKSVFSPAGPYFNHPSVRQKQDQSVWDANGPPVHLNRGETLITRIRDAAFGRTAEERSDTRSPDFGKRHFDSPLPVVEFRDNQIPGLTALGTPVEAAEALACRASVINYVINATDGKDECEGLTKAFEKTCQKTKPGARRSLQRRTFREKIRQTHRWKSWGYELSMNLKSRIKYWVSAAPNSLTFFAEDAVAGDAFEDARYVVENNFDQDVYLDLRDHFIQRQRRRVLQDDPAINRSLPLPITKPLSMDLPKAGSRVSSDTLDIINQGDLSIVNETSPATPKSEDAMTNENPTTSKTEKKKKVEEPPYDPNSPEARMCCVSILNVYQENCGTEPEENVSDTRLFFVVLVMAMCGVVKSLIRYFRILWMPEAGGCILVGVLTGYFLMYFPHHDISFDGNWFLRILVPPIVFEAALGIDKRSFNRHLVPILLYAIVGTLLATFLTAFIVHRGSIILSGFCPAIPFVEALTFGALISSIDPIAVLSVLSNMGMTDTDTIYVVIFGESLLNDGVAIVLFHTLVHFLDETLVIDPEAVTDAAVHFFVVAFGSLLVGGAAGIVSTVYYWLFYQCQNPMVEVIMFFCWALFPYYICDGIGWSGIVAVVATGFVMDLHIVGQKKSEHIIPDNSEEAAMVESVMAGDARRVRRPIFSPEGHLSERAKTHIGFVTELIATAMEMAIFAYLGLFLFSHRYHWHGWHSFLAISACCISRGIMIPALSLVANWITRVQQLRATCQRGPTPRALKGDTSQVGVVIDRRMQLALWFAGLRGAMSFALVEHIPLYDAETGEGTRLKPELKAMTSASIMFTVFILGGTTFYMMEYLGVSPQSNTFRKNTSPSPHELAGLLAQNRRQNAGTKATNSDAASPETLLSGNQTTFRRARHLRN